MLLLIYFAEESPSFQVSVVAKCNPSQGASKCRRK